MTNTNNKKIRQIAEMIENLGKPITIPVLNAQIPTIPKESNEPLALTPADQMKAYRSFVESLNANADYFMQGENILNEFMSEQPQVDEDIVEEDTLEETTTLFKILAKPGTRAPKVRDPSKPGQITKAAEYIPGGRPLLQYLHKYEKLADTTEWDYIGQGQRLQNKEFKSNPDNVLIIVGRHGVAYAKPDIAYIEKQQEKAAARGKSYDPKNDTNLRYRVVAFDKDLRVDNMLIPDEYEMETVTDPATGKQKQQVKRDPDSGEPIVAPGGDRSAERVRGKLSPDAPVTHRDMRRIGKPQGVDRQNPGNFFDMLRGAIGQITKVYVGSSSLMKSREFDASKWVHKDFKPGLVPPPETKFVLDPETGKQKKIAIPHIASPKTDVPGATRATGAVARDVMTGRQYLRGMRPATEEVLQALHPALDKLLPKAINKVNSDMAAAQSANKTEEADHLARTANDLQDALTALQSGSDYSNEALAHLGKVIEKTVASYTDASDTKALDSALSKLASQREGLPQFWRAFMANLTNPNMWI